VKIFTDGEVKRWNYSPTVNPKFHPNLSWSIPNPSWSIRTYTMLSWSIRTYRISIQSYHGLPQVHHGPSEPIDFPSKFIIIYYACTVCWWHNCRDPSFYVYTLSVLQQVVTKAVCPACYYMCTCCFILWTMLHQYDVNVCLIHLLGFNLFQEFFCQFLTQC
jgi:hypothetical protein